MPTLKNFFKVSLCVDMEPIVALHVGFSDVVSTLSRNCIFTLLCR